LDICLLQCIQQEDGAAGAGTQTAGLAFGGRTPPGMQEQQKNMTELIGLLVELWEQEDI
jgi:hypothetical protein